MIVKSGLGVKARGGFSLIEVMIGMVLLAVGLIAISAMVPTAYTNLAASGTDTQALAFAQRRLDELRSIPYADPCLAAGGPYSSAPTNCTAIGFTAPASGYTVNYLVEDNNPINGNKRLTVSVTGPRNRQTQLVSIITQ